MSKSPVLHKDNLPVPSVPVPVLKVLRRLGWEIRSMDLDLTRDKVDMRLFRDDGRWLHLSTPRSGRAVIERWHREPTIERASKRGPQFDAFRDEFLGRIHCGHPRQALRTLCDYLADNPAPDHAALPAAEVRDAVRLLMG